ncbi:hypothetical protein [Methylobacterium sp. Leaf106]|uniref:hypothetical protein n=1 Tax=Methylobacterium sp. Leaf106 TaxID=1736255 RepID=UPI0006FC91BC|nr:hypothetical protein [Methylobacterium sp. Leaf106]KQP53057.1 hypothetical protein ASF34_01425 [Methylobacterium sp. Leaf106]
MKQVALTPFENLTHRQRAEIADLWWERNDTAEIGARLNISEANVARVLARQQLCRRDLLVQARRA